ncbi:MAG: T9SS type A sorting domain-containing protein [Chlorobi bacterium]|nr:T9SS type A sorting domain-containing protein [Chlorobiota bacterium]
MNDFKLNHSFLGFIIILLLFGFETNAQNSTLNHRDSINVIHYNINLDFSFMANHNINANTELIVTPLFNNTQQLAFDLLKLTVDSVFVDSIKIDNYTYNDSVLRIPINPVSTSDTLIVRVYYNGHPVTDPSGWGGFYWYEDGAYNMGVGMQANPHGYGRIWYPCIDNFTGRATYDYYITTNDDKMAVCDGTLLDTENIGNSKKKYHWRLHNTIPTYLSSFAVGGFTSVNGVYEGVQGNIPTYIYVKPVDSINAVNSFINLNATLHAFEEDFGPYFWERVGYVVVPFNGGAMEHATNIAYPEYAVDGTLNSETLYAHELSHHWFGDLVTCKTEGDMWLNEGWASYCESIFKEKIYGKRDFKNYVRSNHLSVLISAAKTEDGFLALARMPHKFTYGKTVYDKGADVVHTLRGYLGDSLFFRGVSAYLNYYKFSDASSENLRDFLTDFTGVNLNDFFSAWVFSPGFRQFSVDSFNVNPVNSEFEVDVYMHQRLRKAPDFSNSNRLELKFMNNNWEQNTQIIEFSGETGHGVFTVPFEPDFILVDPEEKISDATTDYTKTITEDGNYFFSSTYFNCFVNNLTDSMFVRVEHHWVPPDVTYTNTKDFHLSKYFYWTVNAIIPELTTVKGKFSYNFNNSEYYANKDIDKETIIDSLTILYRPDASVDWREISHFFSGSQISGYFLTDSLLNGDYAVGIKESGSNSKYFSNNSKKDNLLNIYPNPSDNIFTISFNIADTGKIVIYDFTGKEVFNTQISKGQKITNWNPQNCAPGIYSVELFEKNVRLITKKILYN